MDIARGLGDATGVTKNWTGQAKSAGILDPAKKLAAVEKNSDMQRVAKQLAAGWTAEAAKLAKAAPAAATPPARGGAGAFADMTNRLAPPATKPLPEAVATPPRFNAANVMQMPGMQPAGKKPAPTTPTPGTPPGFNAANVMKMPGMPGQPPIPGAITPGVAKLAPATPPKPGTPPGFNAVNPFKMPGMPGQPPIPGAITPGAAKPGPAAPGAATPPIRGGAGAFDDMTNRLAKGGAGQPDAETPPVETPPAGSAEDAYWKQFLAYVNKKTAIRDASTYQMIGLKQIQDQSGFKNELEAAKAKILQAYKDGQDVTPAATEYILTAMAGAQLISSKNRAGVELEQPEVDPNNPDAAAGADGAAADGAAPGTAPTAGGKILDTAGVQAVFKNNGVDPAVLYKLGKTLQQTSGTTAVNTTGNGTVDNMLKALGFKVT
jgi:hypothetical protein